VTTRLAGYLDDGAIMIRLTDDEEGIDVGMPLDADEARRLAAHLTELAGDLDAENAARTNGGVS
jgi:hypothetical protein